MVFVVIGVLAGPLVLDDLNASPRGSTVRALAEATLVLALFSDVSRIDVRALRRESTIPVRLLAIGLPLTVVLGSLVAAALFGHVSLSEAVIIGVILAPTDAGCGRPSSPTPDARLPIRAEGTAARDFEVDAVERRPRPEPLAETVGLDGEGTGVR